MFQVAHRRALRGEPPSSPGSSTPLRIVARHNSEPDVQQSLAAWTRLSSCWTPHTECVEDAAAKSFATVGFSFGQGADLTTGGTNGALAWQVNPRGTFFFSNADSQRRDPRQIRPSGTTGVQIVGAPFLRIPAQKYVKVVKSDRQRLQPRLDHAPGHLFLAISVDGNNSPHSLPPR